MSNSCSEAMEKERRFMLRSYEPELGVEACFKAGGVGAGAVGPLSGKFRRALEPYKTRAASSYASAASSAVP